MARIVQKYGGTSVGSIEKIKAVAERVIEASRQGNQMVVVLSAMAGQTDGLINLAKEIDPDPDSRELDVLMATGEQVSVALFAMAVKSMGHDARSLLGFQAAIHTDDLYGRARIQNIEIDRIIRNLDAGRIVTVAGFQGVNAHGDITTLGRGGSDYTAAIVGAGLSGLLLAKALLAPSLAALRASPAAPPPSTSQVSLPSQTGATLFIITSRSSSRAANGKRMPTPRSNPSRIA